MNLVRAPPVTTAIGAVAVGIGGGGLAAVVVMRLTRVGALEERPSVSASARLQQLLASRSPPLHNAHRHMIDRIAAALARRNRFTTRRPRQAAILLPLLTSTPTPSLLLTRRAETLSSHKGQVAFPGGRTDDADNGPIDTALREAHEEVGLNRADIKVLGMLDDLPSFNNDTAVTPVVGLVSPNIELQQLIASKGEVARIFAIPLDELIIGDRWDVQESEWRGAAIQQFYFKSQGETLWGLSAYATLMMLSLVEEGSTAPVPRWFDPQGKREGVAEHDEESLLPAPRPGRPSAD